MKSILVAILILSCSICEATTIRVNSKQGGKSAGGSATIIGGLKDSRVAVLSCAHVFFARGEHFAEMTPGKWVPAEIISMDRDNDLSLLAVQWGEKVNVQTVSPSAPATGETLLCRGFPMMKDLREQRSHVTGTLEGSTLWQVNTPFISGESGGSVISSSGLCGVIVASDDPEGLSQGRVCNPLSMFIPRGMRPSGYIVSWGVVSGFVKKAAPDGVFDDKNPPPAPPADEGKFVRPEPKEEVEELKEQLAGEYSKARIIVLVQRQSAADMISPLAERAESLVSSIIGSYVSEKTDNALDVEVVFERTNKARFDGVKAGSEVLLGDYVSAVILIKKQDSGLLLPMKKIATGLAQRAIDSNLGQLPVKVIMEREYPERFRAVEDAMLLIDKPEPAKDGSKDGEEKNFAMLVFGFVLRFLREAIPWLKGNK